MLTWDLHVVYMTINIHMHDIGWNLFFEFDDLKNYFRLFFPKKNLLHGLHMFFWVNKMQNFPIKKHWFEPFEPHNNYGGLFLLRVID